MTTAYACYALVLAALIGVVAVLAERGLMTRRLPVRWVWLVAMSAMAIMPAARLVMKARAVTIPLPVAMGSGAARTSPASPGVLAPAPAARERPAVSAGFSLAVQWEQALTRVEQRTRVADRLLITVWALLTGVLALIAWRARRQLHRLTRTLATQHVQGTVVHVSDAIGPAAIGGRTPAIVIPAWVLELDRALLALVLRHEQEHLRARDPRLLSLAVGWLVLMPWHVPLWWAWHRLRLAIELDCDARVLRGTESPRAYAQLLIFMSQRRTSPRSASYREAFGLPLSLSLLLSFNPHVHHLTRRINAMTTRPVMNPVRLLCVATGIMITATLAAAIPAPTLRTFTAPTAFVPAKAPARAADTVLVKVTRLGLHLDAPTSSPKSMEILIYGDGPVRVGIGTAGLNALRDTMRLDHLSAFTADVTNGDVHVEMRRTAGTIELGGDVTGGAISSFTIRARHVVLTKRATGVRAGSPNPLDAKKTPGAKGGNRAGPTRAATDTATLVSRDALRLADSVGTRKATAELQRVQLLATYAPTFARITELDQEIAALDAVLERLPSTAAWRATGQVIDALQARRDGLGLELDRLTLKYEAFAPSIAVVRAELDLLRKRQAQLQRMRARLGPPKRPSAIR
jgi:beta-lactamase regulating signal transducer with metallopeptidase domain